MEAIKTIHICRVCLNEDKNLQSIDPTVFEFCTGINIAGREYSSHICAACDKLLSALNEFKNCCIRNERLIDDFYLPSVVATEVKEEKLEIFAEPIDLLTVKEELDEEESFVNEEIDNVESDVDDVVPSVKPKMVGKRSKLCPLCGKMFTDCSIYVHLASHNEDPTLRYPCDLCDKTFTLKTNVQKHKETVHEKVKKHPCEICNEMFVHPSTRRRHLANVHSAIEKPHVCTICGKKYLQKSQLEKHMTLHTNEKPHKCEICFKSFRCKQQFINHMNTHTNEKRFPCESCEKSFSTRSSMNMHARIHTGFKDFVCPVCSKEFMQSHVMKSHCRSNHPEYELPPTGTIMSRRYWKNLKEAESVAVVNNK